MWIVLPTKGCACTTCVKLREVVNEEGAPVPGTSFDLPMGPFIRVNVPDKDGWGDTSKGTKQD
jgi:hypothetical protein